MRKTRTSKEVQIAQREASESRGQRRTAPYAAKQARLKAVYDKTYAAAVKACAAK